MNNTGLYSLRTKFIFLFILIAAAFCGALYYFSLRLDVGLQASMGNDFQMLLAFRKDMIRFLVMGLGAVAVCLLLMYRNITAYLKVINDHLLKAVVKKKFGVGFQEFDSNDLFQEITHNANAMFQLFKNFDQMKSARISMEVATNKLMMNTIDAGVVLLSQDKIVTHINHPAEEMLRLIPGEVIGETITRHISDSTFLNALDQTIQHDQKVSDLALEIREGSPLNLMVFPIKNKLGEMVRVLVVLKSAKLAAKSKKTAASLDTAPE